jgi:hypothetical protein
VGELWGKAELAEGVHREFAGTVDRVADPRVLLYE